MIGTLTKANIVVRKTTPTAGGPFISLCAHSTDTEKVVVEPEEAVHVPHSQGAEDQLEERGKRRRTGRGQGGARLQGYAERVGGGRNL